MRVLMAGGGTGGHIIPNIAIIKKLKAKDNGLELLYLGSKKGMESHMIPAMGVPFKSVSCGKLRRYFAWENFVDFFRTVAGVFQSFYYALQFNADVIFCKGGFVSLPVAVGGKLAGKKVIIHESDFVPGLANKISAKFAAVICVSFKESAAFFPGKKVVVSGNPVREELSGGDRAAAIAATGLTGQKPVVLVMGGSQGAAFINELIWQNLPELLEQFEIIHLCGAGKMRSEIRHRGYFTAEYAHNELKDFYALAQVVITRAGANSLAELAFLQKAALIIPLVRGSRGDQVGNAIEYAREYPALIIDERKPLTGGKELCEALLELLKQKNRFPEKINNAADIISDLILSHAKN